MGIFSVVSRGGERDVTPLCHSSPDRRSVLLLGVVVVLVFYGTRTWRVGNLDTLLFKDNEFDGSDSIKYYRWVHLLCSFMLR